jgi:hypothetical protein
MAQPLRIAQSHSFGIAAWVEPPIGEADRTIRGNEAVSAYQTSALGSRLWKAIEAAITHG